MEPIKPRLREAEVFVGKYGGEELLSFVPTNSSILESVRQGEPLRCEDHILEGSAKVIRDGEEIVAVKWRLSRTSRGVKIYGVRFYCSVACQRHHAVHPRGRDEIA
jgi:hypothetical protein